MLVCGCAQCGCAFPARDRSFCSALKKSPAGSSLDGADFSQTGNRRCHTLSANTDSAQALALIRTPNVERPRERANP
jgi:hypothetical protein